MRIETSVIINAPSQNVWDALVDFEQYPYWNPYIQSIEGSLKIAEKLYIVFPTSKMYTKVEELEIGYKFSWSGRIVFKGVMDILHKFEIKPMTENRCEFIQSESFSGILIPLLKDKIRKSAIPDFEAMNEALKDLVENK